MEGDHVPEDVSIVHGDFTQGAPDEVTLAVLLCGVVADVHSPAFAHGWLHGVLTLHSASGGHIRLHWWFMQETLVPGIRSLFYLPTFQASLQISEVP